MKTKLFAAMFVAAVTVVGFGASTAAYADGEGGVTATALAWEHENGIFREPATVYYAQRETPATQQHAAATDMPAQTSR